MIDYWPIIQAMYPRAIMGPFPDKYTVVMLNGEIDSWPAELGQQPSREELDRFAQSAEYQNYLYKQQILELEAELNTLRGQQRSALGLTRAEFQEMTYSGKMMMAIFYRLFPGMLDDLINDIQPGWMAENHNLFRREATARGITHPQMVSLIIKQGLDWLAASDAIEANYVTERGNNAS